MNISDRLTIAIINAIHSFNKRIAIDYISISSAAANIGVSKITAKKYAELKGILIKIAGVNRIKISELESFKAYVNERLNQHFN